MRQYNINIVWDGGRYTQVTFDTLEKADDFFDNTVEAMRERTSGILNVGDLHIIKVDKIIALFKKYEVVG